MTDRSLAKVISSSELLEAIVDAIADRVVERLAKTTSPVTRGKLLTTREIETELRISHSAFCRLIKDPGFPIVQVGGVNRFDIDEVRTWLANRPAPKRLTKEPNDIEDGNMSGVRLISKPKRVS